MEKLHSAAGPGGQDGKTQRKGLKPAEGRLTAKDSIFPRLAESRGQISATSLQLAIIAGGQKALAVGTWR